jgi:transcriptional regulator with XRE-family HTH domain
LTFGEEIKKSREKLGISQEEAAQRIKKLYEGVRLSPSYLSMIESGSKTNLTTNLIDAILDFYKLPSSVANTLFAKSYLSFKEDSLTYDDSIVAPYPTTGDPMDDFPPEALKEIEDFRAYVRHKYRGYNKNQNKAHHD